MKGKKIELEIKDSDIDGNDTLTIDLKEETRVPHKIKLITKDHEVFTYESRTGDQD